MKRFKRNLNQICKILVAVILLFSLGAMGTVSSARRIHHHVRTSRRVIRHRHRKRRGAIRFRRHCSKRQNQRLTTQQIRKDCSELDRQTIKDVNQDRRRYRLPELHLNRQLSKIGSQRSRQLQSYFSHNTKQHQNEAQYLLDSHNINYDYYGENIASSPLGKITILDVGPYNNPTNATSRYLTYHAKNGYQLANNINNASMYHDAGDNNGHRANDLDRQFKQMGVGVSYNRHDKNFYISVEFID